MSFSLTIASKVLTWHCDLGREEPDSEPSPQVSGSLGARLDHAGTARRRSAAVRVHQACLSAAWYSLA